MGRVSHTDGTVKTVEKTVDGTDALHVIVDYGVITPAEAAITAVTSSTVTASTTSGTALAANANRKNATIVNNGLVDVTIKRGTGPAVHGTGIVLKANGGAYEINSTNLYKGIITCIAASGTAALAIEEGV